MPIYIKFITWLVMPSRTLANLFGLLVIGLLVVSYLNLTQSVLGPFLPGTNTSSVVEVIHAFRLRGRGPRIVAIGGGTGLTSLLRGLKTYSRSLPAVVTVAGRGDSSHRLPDDDRTLRPGDLH